jgi:hypothetical protein
MSFILSLFEVVITLVLCHALHLLDPGFEDVYQDCVANLIDNFSDHIQEVFPALAIVVRHFSFDVSKEEEVIRSKIWAVGWMQQPFGFGSFDAFLR